MTTTTHGNNPDAPMLPPLSTVMRHIGQTRPHAELVQIRKKVLAVYNKYPNVHLSALAMVAYDFHEEGKTTNFIIFHPAKKWRSKARKYAQFG